MKAAYIRDNSKAAELVVGDVPMPTPNSKELLIRVSASGVTPTELLWVTSTHTRSGEPRTHAIPGHEFSGVVISVGDEVKGFAPGDEVYGMNDWYQQGATAEYCLAAPSGLAKKPSKLSHEQAAVVPIGALTAWQGLFVHGKLRAGDRLLVHGAAGAVGVFVTQFAKLHGAQVVATCSGSNVELLQSLKADQVINYETTRFEDAVSNVDMVFDAVGGDTLQRSWALLNPGGHAVTIAADSEGTTDERVKAAFFIVEPSQQQLSDLEALFEAGTLRTFVGEVASLDSAPSAYRGELRGNGAHGKTVLVP